MKRFFVVRDRWGYVISKTENELTRQELLDLSCLADEANLNHSTNTWCWETEADWCPCGDPDCYARTGNGGNSCDCR